MESESLETIARQKPHSRAFDWKCANVNVSFGDKAGVVQTSGVKRCLDMFDFRLKGSE
jgi:hypothetical protein